MSKKILQISPFSAYPPSSGGQQRVHGLMQAHGSAEVTRIATRTLALDSLSDAGVVTHKNIDENYREIVYNSPLVSISNKVFRTLGSQRWSHARMLVYSDIHKIARWHPLHSFLTDEWDFIILEHPWMAPIVPDDTAATIIYSSHNVETEYYDALTNGQGSHWVRRQIRKLEKSALELSDATITVSERDARMFQDRYGKRGPYHVAYNAAELPSIEDIQFVPNLEQSGPLRACFVGSGSQVNVQAAKHVVEIASELSELSDQIKFEIIGTVCERLPDRLPENVAKRGFVDDLTGELATIDIGLNPVTDGGGSNVKVAEYLSHGLVVLTTPFGARGIPGQEDCAYLIRKLRYFERIIKKLLQEELDILRISKNGRRLAEKELNWYTVSENFFNSIIL